MNSLAMHQIIIYLIFTLVAVFLFSNICLTQNVAVSPNTDEAIIRELTTRFYYDREKPDLEDYLSLWSPKSTDDSSNREMATRSWSQWEKSKVEKFIIHNVKVRGETATVRVTVKIVGTNKKSGQVRTIIACGRTRLEECNLTHKLVKENGKWLLLWNLDTAEVFATEVLAANSDAERETLLAENRDLVARGFISILSILAVNLASKDFDYLRALKNLRLALRLAEEKQDKEMIAQSVNLIAGIYLRLGDHGLALLYDQRYLQLTEELGNAAAASNARNSVGATYSILGDYPRALIYYQRGLETRISNPNPIREAEGLGLRIGNIGNTYLNLNNLAGARESFEKLRVISEGANYKVGLSRAFVGFGDIYRVEGNYPAALESYLKALELVEGSKVEGFNQYIMKKIGETYLLLRKYPEALKNAEEAARLADEIGIKDFGWDARVTAGKAYLALNQPEQARAAFEDAINSIEVMRRKNLGGEDAQQRFFEDKSAPYNAMIDLLVSQSQTDEAFAFAEKSKARVLLALLMGGRNTVTKSMTPAETQNELRLAANVAQANTLFERENQNPQADRKRLEDFSNQLNNAKLEYETFRSQLFIDHPELKVQRGEMKPITIEEAGSLLPDNRTAIAEYVVADDRTFLFVITQDISKKALLKVFPIEVKGKQLAKTVEAFRAKIASGDLDFQKSSRELFDLLLKPAQAQLSGKTNLIIVPDGPLWDLPFQSLKNEKNLYLIEQTAISYAPSLTALREMSKKAQDRTPGSNLELLAFGNPIVGQATSERIKQVFMSEKLEPLPESERLVKELGRMYGSNRSKVFVGNEAREETAKAESPKFRIVQFATHGILNNISPMYSHLVLAKNDKNQDEDVMLEALDMKDLDLKADLVILSACETARGRISNGEGVIGMSWALFIAGVPTTVASQWKVESSSTTELMLEFHRQLLTGRSISKAEALRRASLKLLKTPNFKHPSYWAAFVLVGDGF